jgi:predicted ATPase/class 3 adenylate cyclase
MMSSMPAYPSGTVTFVFTDVEGSTALAQHDPQAWSAARDRHHAILHSAIESHGGYVFQVIGDAFCAAFSTAGDAVLAAVEAQRELAGTGLTRSSGGAAPGMPVRVRMGIHAGEARLRPDGDYEGYLTLARAQRVVSAARGEQVLLSQAAAELVHASSPGGVRLRPLGAHQLKGFDQPEQLFQCEADGLRADFPPIRSLIAHPNNLPLALTSFVGRAVEQAEIGGLLSSGPSRIVTLTGVGGTGKTRLALQVGGEVLERFADGVWLIELAPVADPAQVPNTVAAALAVREEPGRALRDTLVDNLREHAVLLILDNCEHLLVACAELAEHLLRQCRSLRILATSREALGIPGEVAWNVPSLTLPPTDGDLVAVLQSEAAQLFIERAAAANRAFAGTPENAPAVAQICRRLDGIPLALELAAGRIRSLRVEEVAARLDDRFRLLAGGSRTALPRQRTLLGTIDWSHSLLDEPERALLRRLSVFAGSWTLETAESVCAERPGDVLDLLSGLVGKSLVVFDEGAGRYRMLETIRQYAGDRLLEAGEGNEYRARHLAHFARLANEAGSKLQGTQLSRTLAVLDVERDNLRAALGWALEHGEPQATTGGELVQALGEFWILRGQHYEARDWHQRAVEVVREPGPLRARLLERYGSFEWQQGDLREARAHIEEAARLCEAVSAPDEVTADTKHVLGHVLFDQGDHAAARAALGDSRALYQGIADDNLVAVLTSDLGMVAFHLDDLDSAEGSFEEALGIFRRLGNQGYAADTLARLGDVARTQGDPQRAHARYEESLAIARPLGLKPELAQALHRSAYPRLREGDVAEARARLRESLALQQEIGNRQGIAECLGAIAGVALAEGDPDRAGRLLGAQAALLARIGVPLSPADRAEVQRDTAAASARLGAAAFDAALAAGCALTMDEAIALATAAERGRGLTGR